MRARRHLKEVSITKWLLPGKTHAEPCQETLLFFLIVPTHACLCLCVCTVHACPYTNTPPPPLQLTGRWMLAVTPAWICSCQMWRGHGESTKTLINLKHCPASCWSLPVVSNIYLVTVDTGKSAHVHRNQAAKPTDLHKAVTNTGAFWSLLPSPPPLWSNFHSHWQVVLMIIIITQTENISVIRWMWVGCSVTWSFYSQQHQSQMTLGELKHPKGNLTLPTSFIWMCENVSAFISKSKIKCILFTIKPFCILSKPQNSITFEKSL